MGQIEAEDDLYKLWKIEFLLPAESFQIPKSGSFVLQPSRISSYSPSKLAVSTILRSPSRHLPMLKPAPGMDSGQNSRGYMSFFQHSQTYSSSGIAYSTYWKLPWRNDKPSAKLLEPRNPLKFKRVITFSSSGTQGRVLNMSRKNFDIRPTLFLQLLALWEWKKRRIKFPDLLPREKEGHTAYNFLHSSGTLGLLQTLHSPRYFTASSGILGKVFN